MTKKEARSIAVDFVWNSKNVAYEALCKYQIDDRGTMSETGYEDADYEKIEKELDIILARVLKMKLKSGKE